MESQDVIQHAKRSANRIVATNAHFEGVQAELVDFPALQVGPRRAFYQRAKEARGYYIKDILLAIINAFIAYIEAGLQAEVSPERRAQLDVVSDFLEQSRVLLETKGVHPAAPAVLIGAARR